MLINELETSYQSLLKIFFAKLFLGDNIVVRERYVWNQAIAGIPTSSMGQIFNSIV